MEGKRRNGILRKFGMALRRYRRIAKLTQEDLADMAGIERSHVGTIERGENNLTLISIVKLCDALKINPSDLLTDLDKWPKGG
jgi:transcriptional regulator with XRE-family HTH domain